MFKKIFLILILLVSFGILTKEVKNNRVGTFDDWVEQKVNRVRNSKFDRIMPVVTVFGSAAILIPLVMVVAIYKKSWLLIFAAAGSELTNQVLKVLVDRQRPVMTGKIFETTPSFPSGHALNSLVLYGLIWWLVYRKKYKYSWLGLLFIVGLIGFSRVYIGVHYPTDVLGGYLVGGVILIVSLFSANFKDRHLRF